MTDIWHRHESDADREKNIGTTAMQHAHDGGDKAHQHTLRDQAQYTTYAGVIDEPTEVDPNLAIQAAKEAAAESLEEKGDELEEVAAGAQSSEG